jgi:hypothetical protein
MTEAFWISSPHHEDFKPFADRSYLAIAAMVASVVVRTQRSTAAMEPDI